MNKSLFLGSKNTVVLPGFCDVHVHFREPGFSYKESIKTGSLAAAHGGYTVVCTMPNLNPVPDSVANLEVQLKAIKENAAISVYPYASITVGQNGKQLTDFDSLKDLCVAFSDDGKGVQDEEIMIKAMEQAKKHNKILVCHCEDNSLLNDGYIHKGEYCKRNGHKGISSESEYAMIARDLKLLEKYDCAYHVCHVSAKESVELIRNAKKKGLNVTCETAPHYLILDDEMLKDEGRFKMNPPIRSVKDRDALIEGVENGTIDMIATDHAPHSLQEKSGGLRNSLFGISGIEIAFSLMYTHFVKKGIFSINKLISLFSYNPSKRFNINLENDFSVWDLDGVYKVNPEEFFSKGKSTPFEGCELNGINLLTVKNGNIVYKK